MKTFYLAIIALSFSTLSVYAQDIITFKTGDEVKAKVEEVGTSEIVYKKFDNPTGVKYSVSKSDVFMIVYENGQKEVFKTTNVEAPKNTNQQPNEKLSPISLVGNKFIMNTKILRRDKVEEIFLNSANKNCITLYHEGNRSYSSGKKLFVWGLVLGIGGVVIGASSPIDNNTNSSTGMTTTTSSNTGPEDAIRAVALGVGLVGWGMFGYSFVLKSRSNKKFKEAVSLYNAAF